MKHSKKSYILLAVILSFCFLNCNKSVRKLTAPEKAALEYSKILTRGALLVRLNSADNKIEALKNAGESKKANKLIEELAVKRIRTIQAFTDYFDYAGRIYFFENSETKHLKARAFEKVKLLSIDGRYVQDAEIFKKGFIIAAFDRVFGTQKSRDENNKSFIELSNQSTPGLVLLDENFHQIMSPFPYKAFAGDHQHSERDAVRNLNKQLYEFYLRFVWKTQRDGRLN